MHGCIHAGTLSDLARIKEAFKSVRKEKDFAREPVSICTDARLSNTFLPHPPPQEKLVHICFLPIS